ncbi:hypothetical protein BOG92_054115 [Streptomyces sp. WAC00263]|nr:hypothetical protein BOG92_054115 [Streptomyces sp. WAC00263]
MTDHLATPEDSLNFAMLPNTRRPVALALAGTSALAAWQAIARSERLGHAPFAQLPPWIAEADRRKLSPSRAWRPHWSAGRARSRVR